MLFIFLLPFWGKDILAPSSYTELMKLGQMIVFLTAMTRPITSFLIGKIGDRIGRKQALILCTCLMSIASLIISYIPNYCPSFIYGPWLVIGIVFFCRILQNASAGGKLNGSAIYLIEHYPKLAGLMSGFIWSVTILGMIIACLTESWCATHTNGWRIGMRTGAFASLAMLSILLQLQEGEEFVKSKSIGNPEKHSYDVWGKISVICMGCSVGGMYYYLINYIPTYYKILTNIDPYQIKLVMLTLYGIGAIIGGILSDKGTTKEISQFRVVSSYILLLLCSCLMCSKLNIRFVINNALNFCLVLPYFISRRSNRWVRGGAILRGLNICYVYYYDPLTAISLAVPLLCTLPTSSSLYSVIAIVILSLPCLALTISTSILSYHYILILLAGMFVGPSHKLMHFLFPPNKRYASISLFYSIGTAFMGGAASCVCLGIQGIHPILPAAYLSITAAIGALGIISSNIYHNEERHSLKEV